MEDIMERDIWQETKAWLWKIDDVEAIRIVNSIPMGGMRAILNAVGARDGYNKMAQTIWDGMKDDLEKGMVAHSFLAYLYEVENWTWEDMERGGVA